MKLSSRFTLLLAVLVAAVVVVLLSLFDSTLERAVEDRIVERLGHEAEHLSDDLAGRALEGDAERDAFLRRAAARLSCRITLTAADGRVLHETGLRPADVAQMENHAGRPEIRQAQRAGKGLARRFSDTAHTEMLYIARRLEISAGPPAAVLRLAVSVPNIRAIERAYLWPVRLGVFGACVLLFVIGAAASRRFSRSIQEMTRAASAIAAGEFKRDLPQRGGEEVQRLGAALQRMKDSLSGALARAESERRLTASVFERLPDGLVVVDGRLHVIEANERFSRMIGVPAPAGRALYDLLRHRPLYQVFEETLRAGAVQERTVRLDDDAIWQVVVQPLPAGSRAAAVGVLRDVTRLERTEAMRRTFVADVSHELRTPIASIAAAAETLAGAEADEGETAHLVEVIRRQSERIRELIDDLMDLAQIESGMVPLVKEPLRLTTLLAEVARDLAPAAAEKGIETILAGDDRVTVTADRRRLGQIVRNLLDNAIKFSPPGSPVTLETFREAGRAGFSVRDRGPGIPKSERGRIFQRFYQVDRSRSKSRPGSGLGLSIVKHIAHLHGAVVEVEGEVGQGSTFRVLFPPGDG